jgi:hypothetical protein
VKRLVVPVAALLLLAAPPAQASFTKLLAQSNRYTMRVWYPHRAIGGSSETAVRPAADQAFALAVGLRIGGYERATARRRRLAVRTILAELAGAHPNWGGRWQSALWASRMGLAVVLLRDELPRRVRTAVRRVVQTEANRFIAYRVPYYRRGGAILTPGDSKAEENAWNAAVLAAALDLMPDHPNAHAWAVKNRELLVAALARPEDTNGRYAWLLHGGSNINSDFTVANHGIANHPDYAAAVLGLTDAQVLAAALVRRDPPAVATLNHAAIYRRLAGSYRPDGTIRRPFRDPLVEGRPPLEFAVVDLQARLEGVAHAADWERRHLAQCVAPAEPWVAPYGEAWSRGLTAATAATGVLATLVPPASFR